jgi:hypothetical protein
MDSFLKHAEAAGSTLIQDRVEVVAKIGENRFQVTTQK